MACAHATDVGELAAGTAGSAPCSISISISNIVGALRCDLGADATTITFVRPTPPDSFDDVWRRFPGVTSTNMDYAFGIEPSDELSREDLRAFLEARYKNGAATDAP